TLSSLRVIADHIRACAFLIVDDVMPSNEGRGYVLRRIIRRAIRHGYRLGIRDVFFYKLVAPLVEVMGEAYPELAKIQRQVEHVLEKEEQRFSETLEQGMKILESAVTKMTGRIISGDVAFLLYDTYGFPLDLTADFARENNLSVDHAQFDIAMNAQRELARGASNFNVAYDYKIDHNSQTEFTGYHSLTHKSKIIDLYVEGQSIDLLQINDEAVIILNETPFYGESGGQIGDSGLIEVDGGVFEVMDTQKQAGTLFLHQGKVISGEIKTGQACRAIVNATPRKATELNHSATHLLHAALRHVLGQHVNQKGSLVNSQTLRFDFSHLEPMTVEQINQAEVLVNQHIRLNHLVSAEVMPKDAAMLAGAMALFGEKYGDEVRVLKMGQFSTELCGGTHVERTGEIGFFKILSETGIASGVRRVEAVTGQAAQNWVQQSNQTLNHVAQLLKSSPNTVEVKAQQ
ncbi:MAG: alanine--tRNA ligase, partial [Methylococcales bacterium]|nr:alanine--tRNA ligase [Methylococcales bacterium]